VAALWLRVEGQHASLGGLPPDAGAVQPPGRGIPYLALIDVIVLFTMALMGAGLLLPDRLHGRVQGVITLVASIVLIVVAVTLLVIASVLLLAMVSLFFAPPFGTIAYLVIWGSFPRGDAAVLLLLLLLLSLLMFLKIVFVVMLVLAQPRFLHTWYWRSCTVSYRSSWSASWTTWARSCPPWSPSSGIVLLVGSIPAIVKAATA